MPLVPHRLLLWPLTLKFDRSPQAARLAEKHSRWNKRIILATLRPVEGGIGIGRGQSSGLGSGLGTDIRLGKSAGKGSGVGNGIGEVRALVGVNKFVRLFAFGGVYECYCIIIFKTKTTTSYWFHRRHIYPDGAGVD